MSNEEVVDDNYRRFVYSPVKEWEIITATGQWEGTIHSTWTFDATASLNFTGIQIKVYITVPAGTGASAVDISLDGLNGERRSQRSNATALYNFEFFDSGPLFDGDHTIVMTNKGEDDDQDFQLDRVLIVRGSTSLSSSTAALPSSTLHSTLSPVTQSPTAIVIVAKKASGTPIIVSSVVAGVVALAIMGALLFLYNRRQKRSRKIPVPEEKPPSHHPNLNSARVVSPFTTLPAAIDINSPSSNNFEPKGLQLRSQRLGMAYQ